MLGAFMEGKKDVVLLSSVRLLESVCTEHTEIIFFQGWESKEGRQAQCRGILQPRPINFLTGYISA